MTAIITAWLEAGRAESAAWTAYRTAPSADTLAAWEAALAALTTAREAYVAARAAG